MDGNTVNSFDSVQHVNNKLEIYGIKYSSEEKDLANTRLQDTSTYATGTNSLPYICNLDMEKLSSYKNSMNI